MAQINKSLSRTFERRIEGQSDLQSIFYLDRYTAWEKNSLSIKMRRFSFYLYLVKPMEIHNVPGWAFYRKSLDFMWKLYWLEFCVVDASGRGWGGGRGGGLRPLQLQVRRWYEPKRKAGIPPGKSDASGGIGPRPTVQVQVQVYCHNIQ